MVGISLDKVTSGIACYSVQPTDLVLLLFVDFRRAGTQVDDASFGAVMAAARRGRCELFSVTIKDAHLLSKDHTHCRTVQCTLLAS